MKRLPKSTALLLSLLLALSGCASKPVKIVPFPVESKKEPTEIVKEVAPKPSGYFLREIRNALEE